MGHYSKDFALTWIVPGSCCSRTSKRTGEIASHRKVRLTKAQVGTNFTGDPFFSDGMGYIISVH